MGIPNRGRLLLALVCGALVSGPTEHPSAEEVPPNFTGERLPNPPRQSEPGTFPETRLPKDFVVATKALFDLGLADPRGCEYREVDVVIHFLGGGKSTTRTRGWVLSAAKPGGDRFVICWNGLVYPAVSVGAPVDLKADVRNAVEADEAARKAGDNDGNFAASMMRRFDPTNAVPEAEAVSVGEVLPLKACLLLRLGEEELARAVWTGWAAGLQKVNNNQEYVNKPYIVLAENWTWYLFDRAVGAHASGDDRIALLTARALAAIGPKAAEMAAKLGVQEYDTVSDGKLHPRYPYQSPTLRPLLADQERRAQERTRGNPPTRGEGRAARIAALIRELDQVSVPQMGQPGYPNLGESPVVEALMAEGEAAVEALLDVLERDPRLTRTVSFFRNFSADRNVLPVYEAAFYVLTRTLETSGFDMADPDPKLGRRARIAAGARAYWAKSKGLPSEERWYRTLLDDRATPDQWVQAAAHIVEPRPADGTRMRGEPLRGKAGPSVVEIMGRRVKDLAGRPPTPDEADRHLATTLALHLSKWDAAAAVPALRDLTARLWAGLAKAREAEPGAGSGVLIAALAMARRRGGDPRALDDYAAWVTSVRVETLKASSPGVFEPIWTWPKHPAMTKAAEELFGGAGSASWRELRTAPIALADLAPSPMSGVRAFRKALLALLADKALMGKVAFEVSGAAGERTGSLNLKFDSGGSYATGFDARDPLAPRTGGTSPLRTCDYLAWLLDRIDGFPAVGLYWPEARRDEAVAACAAFLVRYGDRIRPVDESPTRPRWPRDFEARLDFPKLDHPATPAEVEGGLAIFSLAGEGPARVVPLARRPIPARWVGRKGTPRPDADQPGWIWQAEELQKDGAWSRVYGFVGRHVVARVPAGEIELEPDEGPRGR